MLFVNYVLTVLLWLSECSVELMLAVFFHNQHVCPSCYLSELCIDMVQDSLEKNDRILTNFDVWTRHLNELQNAFF